MWKVGRFLKELLAEWWEDNALMHGAALAYYALLSLPPLLFVGVGLAGFVYSHGAARAQLVAQLQALVGPGVASVIESALSSMHDESWGLTVGLATLLVTASMLFTQLQSSLNEIWDAPPSSRGLRGHAWDRLLAFLMVLAVGALVLSSLVLNSLLSGLNQAYLPDYLSGWGASLLRLAVPFVAFTVLFALVYKALPDVAIEWRDVWIGATVTSALLTLGQVLIGLYLGRSAVSSLYGALGSLILVALWVYYSCQIFILGAEFTRFYARRFGSQVRRDGQGRQPERRAA